jgi:hypothetical protein
MLTLALVKLTAQIYFHKQGLLLSFNAHFPGIFPNPTNKSLVLGMISARLIIPRRSHNSRDKKIINVVLSNNCGWK